MTTGKQVAATGNEAVANALRQIDPDVCAACPITPSGDIVNTVAMTAVQTQATRR